MKSGKVKDSLTICAKSKKKALNTDTKLKTQEHSICGYGSLKSQELWEVKALPSDWGM